MLESEVTIPYSPHHCDTKEPPYYAALEGFKFGLSFLRTQEPRGAPFDTMLDVKKTYTLWVKSEKNLAPR
ncbi:MAG: hypothetical protein HN757_16135 [Calditrichaeota bacterium]|nr:hypothetical protein [Calditrichota bacterium]